jgi:hypothetical protein
MVLVYTRFRSRAICFLLFIAGLSGGMLTKGLLGAVLPLSVLGSFIVVSDILAKKFSFYRYFWLGIGTLCAVAGVGVWYLLLYRVGGMPMLHTALWVNNFGRFSGSQGDHVEPFYYYFVKLPTLFWPYLPLLPFALYRAFCLVRKNSESHLIMLLFLLVPFLLFVCASGKRTVYLLPLYAPCALLCADYLAHLPIFIRIFVTKHRRGLLLFLLALLYAGLFTLAGLSRNYTMIYPLIAAGLLTAVTVKPQLKWSLPLCAGMWALFFVSFDTAISTRRLNSRNSLRPLFEECRELERQGFTITLLNPPERTSGAAYFYLQRNLPEVSKDDAVQPKELRITRQKRNKPAGKEFADDHLIVGLSLNEGYL